MGKVLLGEHVLSPDEAETVEALKLQMTFSPTTSGELNIDINDLCLSAIKIESIANDGFLQKADYILEIKEIEVTQDEVNGVVTAIASFNTDVADVREEYSYGHNFYLPVILPFANAEVKDMYKFSMHIEDSEPSLLSRLKSMVIYSDNPELPCRHEVVQEDW